MLTLVDVGPKTEEGLASLTEQLHKAGYKLSDIEQIVLTHHHPDHVGLLDVFSNSVNIVGHHKTKPWLKKDECFISGVRDFFKVFYERNGVPASVIKEILQSNENYLDLSPHIEIDETISEGDEIKGLPGWKVIDTPGHAQSHISLYHEQANIMIAGDHLLAKISSNALLEAPYKAGEERPKTMLQYRDSLRKVQELSINRVYSGHGPVIENCYELIGMRLKEQEKRATYIKSLMSQSSLSCFELVQKMFPTIYCKQPALTFSEVYGHLELLIQQEEVKVEESAMGQFIFSPLN